MHDFAVAIATPSPISLICALLRGEKPGWVADASDGSFEVFLRTARCHGTTPLLDAKFTDGEQREAWPDAIRRT
jgi:hypothetical protein